MLGSTQLFLKCVLKSCVLWSPHTVPFHTKASLLCPDVTVSRADSGCCALPQREGGWPTHYTAFCGLVRSGTSLETWVLVVSQNYHGHCTASFWTCRIHESKTTVLWGCYCYCIVWHLDFITNLKSLPWHRETFLSRGSFRVLLLVTTQGAYFQVLILVTLCLVVLCSVQTWVLFLEDWWGRADLGLPWDQAVRQRVEQPLILLGQRPLLPWSLPRSLVGTRRSPALAVSVAPSRQTRGRPLSVWGVFCSSSAARAQGQQGPAQRPGACSGSSVCRHGDASERGFRQGLALAQLTCQHWASSQFSV